MMKDMIILGKKFHNTLFTLNLKLVKLPIYIITSVRDQPIRPVWAKKYSYLNTKIYLEKSN